MKILYLECSMGAAGDMLAAALLELFPDRDKIISELNSLGIPGVQFSKEESIKCGITGTHMTISVNGEEEESHDIHDHGHHDEHGHSHHHHAHDEHEHDHKEHSHHHHHSSLQDIEHIVHGLAISEKIKEDIMAVYQLIAQAESHAHGVPVEEIHFHEVGTMDAVSDIAAVCILMDKLSPDQVIASPIHVGSGQVRCAHGILPVPAPATAYILRDVPIYGGNIKGELCTPTGAALLKHFVSQFGNMPVMKIKNIGYGMGKKDFPAANCVRAMMGDAEQISEEICELCCNVDDMTGEAVGFAMDKLFEAGALDVYTIPIGMKKSRPGLLLHVMCREADKSIILETVFKYTSTIGVRENKFRRHVLKRQVEELSTPYGTVRCKVSSGYGAVRRKYEYDDLARIAREREIGISDAAALVDAVSDYE